MQSRSAAKGSRVSLLGQHLYRRCLLCREAPAQPKLGMYSRYGDSFCRIPPYLLLFQPTGSKELSDCLYQIWGWKSNIVQVGSLREFRFITCLHFLNITIWTAPKKKLSNRWSMRWRAFCCSCRLVGSYEIIPEVLKTDSGTVISIYDEKHEKEDCSTGHAIRRNKE